MFKIVSKKRNDPTSIKEMTPTDVAQMVNHRHTAVILDVRSPEEYTRQGHIAESRLMPLATIPVRKNELPLDQPIVCVCRSGARSSAACEVLLQHGFQHVINMKGGMLAWQRAGLPLV